MEQNGLWQASLYGSGLRLRECLRLRVKDVDFEYQQIVVRDGKGQKDRITMLIVNGGGSMCFLHQNDARIREPG